MTISSDVKRKNVNVYVYGTLIPGTFRTTSRLKARIDKDRIKEKAQIIGPALAQHIND